MTDFWVYIAPDYASSRCPKCGDITRFDTVNLKEENTYTVFGFVCLDCEAEWNVCVSPTNGQYMRQLK